MKIGIIGGGYVGQACAKAWKAQGHIVSVTTRQSERVPTLNSIADHIHVISSTHPLEDFIKQQEIILVSVAPSSGADYASTYLETAKQVEDAIPHAPNLKQVIYTSSTSVYGDHQGAWVDELTAAQLTSPQAHVLMETEQVLLQLASSKMSICIFRLGGIYGPGRAIEEHLRRMVGRKFPGTGKSYTNLIHLTDIVEACDFAVTHQLNGIFNLCNDTHIRRDLFYDYLCQIHQIPSIQWDAQQVSLHAGNKRVSNQKLKSLGFIFKESFDLEKSAFLTEEINS
jgi:nucleoside-diphosphate-sugar epimerase